MINIVKEYSHNKVPEMGITGSKFGETQQFTKERIERKEKVN